MTSRRGRWIRRAAIALAVLLALGGATFAVVFWKLFREGEQSFASDVERFKYGSLGAELIAGVPYPIFMILPRVFPDLLPGPGGYGALGFPWEEGRRLPVGFSIKRLGFERVTANCALCHTTPYRLAPDENPRLAVGGPGHTANIQGLLRFLFAAANDGRFTGARLLPEMALHFNFDWLDWVLYKLFIIPATRLVLLEGERQFAWMDHRPAWGPGRDDAFNLPKFVLTQSPWDDTVGTTDFPALWRLGDRDGHLVHWGGEARTVYAVTATSALGAGSLPGDGFVERNRWLESFTRELAPPPFPGPIDRALAARGAGLFRTRCGVCHAPGGARLGTAIPLAEIGTDPEHVRTWSQANADRMNLVTRTLGVRDAELQAAQGYVARPLVGVWLLGPYLHNGSVPTLRDLLGPPARRPKVFHRGYDVIDPDDVGFVSAGPAAEARGFRVDTSERGNGNGGHAYGADLPEPDRRALIEYLKTL
ncbi:MAG TPA: cytochrome c [Geminicoccaceae bacterium]|nr:cytochrome c [Geminicoccaceae bacterium]